MTNSGTKKDSTPNAKVFNIVLPNDLVERVDKIAKSEYHNRSETIREALKDYVLLHSAGRKLHGLSEQARESGDPLQALKLNDEAMIAYEEDYDILGFTENMASRILTLNHLNHRTGDDVFLIYGKYIALAAVELAERSKNPQALTAPLDILARQYEKLGDYEKATEVYKRAVSNITTTPSPIYDRAAVIADFKIRAATCAYRAGDKSALKDAEKALREMEGVEVVSDEKYEEQSQVLSYNQEGEYNFNVWISGAYIRMAEILKTDDPSKAKQYLEKAKEIIDSDSRLTTRKSQWEKLAKEF